VTQYFLSYCYAALLAKSWVVCLIANVANHPRNKAREELKKSARQAPLYFVGVHLPCYVYFTFGTILWPMQMNLVERHI